MRTSLAAGAVLAACIAVPAAAQGLYRHVDERGRVTYSDVPPDKNATPMKKSTGNAGSREAVDQLEAARREQRQHELDERTAAQRRAAAARKSETPSEPAVIPWRRGGYDPTQPPGQSATDSNRRY